MSLGKSGSKHTKKNYEHGVSKMKLRITIARGGRNVEARFIAPNVSNFASNMVCWAVVITPALSENMSISPSNMAFPPTVP